MKSPNNVSVITDQLADHAGISSLSILTVIGESCLTPPSFKSHLRNLFGNKTHHKNDDRSCK